MSMTLHYFILNGKTKSGEMITFVGDYVSCEAVARKARLTDYRIEQDGSPRLRLEVGDKIRVLLRREACRQENLAGLFETAEWEEHYGLISGDEGPDHVIFHSATGRIAYLLAITGPGQDRPHARDVRLA